MIPTLSTQLLKGYFLFILLQKVVKLSDIVRSSHGMTLGCYDYHRISVTLFLVITIFCWYNHSSSFEHIGNYNGDDVIRTIITKCKNRQCNKYATIIITTGSDQATYGKDYFTYQRITNSSTQQPHCNWDIRS
jgi:hypothetical protein